MESLPPSVLHSVISHTKNCNNALEVWACLSQEQRLALANRTLRASRQDVQMPKHLQDAGWFGERSQPVWLRLLCDNRDTRDAGKRPLRRIPSDTPLLAITQSHAVHATPPLARPLVIVFWPLMQCLPVADAVRMLTLIDAISHDTPISMADIKTDMMSPEDGMAQKLHAIARSMNIAPPKRSPRAHVRFKHWLLPAVCTDDTNGREICLPIFDTVHPETIMLCVFGLTALTQSTTMRRHECCRGISHIMDEAQDPARTVERACNPYLPARMPLRMPCRTLHIISQAPKNVQNMLMLCTPYSTDTTGVGPRSLPGPSFPRAQRTPKYPQETVRRRPPPLSDTRSDQRTSSL